MPIALQILPDHEAVSQAIAKRLRAFMGEHAAANLALPSGNTPVRLYALLAEAAKAGAVNFEWANAFALDEYRGLGPDDERAFARFFARHVWGPLAIPEPQRHCLDGRAADPEAECARYEAAIKALGGLDLTLLGLGENGHIAFNEPAETLEARAHVARLAPPASAVAPEGLTMGVGTLLSAPVVLLMATGPAKAEAVARCFSGRVDPRWPASLLQAHPCAEVYLDEAAAAGLPGRAC